jgi:hypothetical protein
MHHEQWRKIALCAIAGAALGGCALFQGDDERNTPAPSSSVSREAPSTAPSAMPPSSSMPAPSTAPSPASSQPGAISDAQLRGFLTASREIEPLTGPLQSGTPEQREQAATQIRASLARNGLDADTYNAIAQQLQTDTVLQARARALQSAP